MRAVRKVHELLELFTQSKLCGTVSTGDSEEQERESETFVFVGAVLALLAMLVWSKYGLSHSTKTTLFDLFWHCYF